VVARRQHRRGGIAAIGGGWGYTSQAGVGRGTWCSEAVSGFMAFSEG